MKALFSCFLASCLFLSAAPATAKVITDPGYRSKTVEHGGGCRKSSPPGQCCHMDRKAGSVHCH